MASLNTLRTKFGWVLSIIIGLALLAFIVTLDDSFLRGGSDPKVGSIDGDKIKYSEYMATYERVSANSNLSEGDEAQSAQLSDMAWNSLIAEHVYQPGFEKMGLLVSANERAGIINGEYFSSTMSSVFADPQTRLYDAASVNEFLQQARTNPDMQRGWNMLVDGAVEERVATKFGALVQKGIFVNRVEIDYGLATTGRTFAGQWVGVRYADQPDSLFTVSDSELKSYYNAHKAHFKQLPSRMISYVVFPVAASEADKTTLETTVREVGAEFAATDNLRTFIANNRNGQIAPSFVTARQISDEMATELSADKPYGPVLNNDQWTMARVVESRMLPDSIGLRHIVLPITQTALADSLLTALRGGADFATLARENSQVETAMNGGDAGVMPFSAFPDEMSATLATAKQGEFLRLDMATSGAIQLIQPYKVGKPVRQMRLATITYPVEASTATDREAYNLASRFMVDGKGSAEKFNVTASDAGLIPREAKLTQGERLLQGLPESRELARWAYGAEVGEISQTFKVGRDYVVAMVTGIDENAYMPLAQATDAIRRTLVKQKKFEQTAAKMQGTTLDQLASQTGTTISDFEGVRYNSNYVHSLGGMEPRVVAAIATTTQTNVLSKPVKGEAGTFAFVVTSITEENALEPGAEKVRQQAAAQQMVQGQLSGALDRLSNVEDLRGQYF